MEITLSQVSFFSQWLIFPVAVGRTVTGIDKLITLQVVADKIEFSSPLRQAKQAPHSSMLGAYTQERAVSGPFRVQCLKYVPMLLALSPTRYSLYAHLMANLFMAGPYAYLFVLAAMPPGGHAGL